MKLSYTYDHYYLYDEILSMMDHFAAILPEFCRITTIGTSTEGRPIRLLEITDTSTGAYEDKPACYVEGNIHAGEVTGSMTVLYLMDTLLSNTEDPKIAALLKTTTFYLLPRVSPDGSEYYLTTPNSVRSLPEHYPYTEDRPGLSPQDLDGDGAIRCMRVPSPYGIWKQDLEDPRLMKLRLPDDLEGTFYNIYTEGLIQEYDGINIHNAPAKYGRDFNRSYPIGWQPEWQQHGAGRFPLETPETQANTAFLMAHPNICSCVDMHTSGGQVLYTPGYKSRKNTEPADIALYKLLGAMASEENGYPLINVYDEYMPQGAPATYGGFDDFCHFIIGIPAFTIECWDLERRAGVPESYPPKDEETEAERYSREQKVLKWLDENLPGQEIFKPWTPFNHPQLGEVEIGGIESKFIFQNPPIPFLEQELEKHVRFLLREAKTLPRIHFDEVTTEKLAEGLYKITAVIGNRGFMPTYVFKEGLKNPALKPLSITLTQDPTLDPEALIEGRAVTDIGHLQGFSGTTVMGWGQPSQSLEGEPNRKKVIWILKAAAGTSLTLTVSGGKAGKITTSVIL